MTTKTVTVDEIQTQIMDLLSQISADKEIIIAKDNNPIAKLVAVRPRKERIAGLNEGEIWTSNDFDAPLPDEFWAGQK